MMNLMRKEIQYRAMISQQEQGNREPLKVEGV